jgi:tripartite-type tricarboxylate transporter receptor subunit TctC
VIKRLREALSKAIADPETRRQLLDLGVDPATERPEDFPAMYRSLVEQWKAVVAETGVTTD